MFHSIFLFHLRRCVVIGTLDGCLSVLAIADPNVPDSYQFLASLPSRTRQAHVPTTKEGRHSFDHNDEEKSDDEYETSNDKSHRESTSGGPHFTLKTAAVVAAAWAKASSQDPSSAVQKVNSKACVIS